MKIYLLSLCLLIGLINTPRLCNAQLTLFGPGNISIQLDTLDGYFGVGTADGYRLMYDFNYPWSPGRGSSHFVISIDDSYYSNALWDLECSEIFTSDYIVESRIIGNTMTTLWEIPMGAGSIRIRQNLTASTYDTLGNAEISYSIFNSDNAPHSVGLLLNFDIRLASRDDAPIAVGFDYSPLGRVYTGDNIPFFWQAYQISPTSTSEQLVVRGFLRAAGDIDPYLFAIGREASFYPPCWEIDSAEITGMRYYDSGLLFRWEPVILSSGKGVQFSTNLGLGEIKAVTGALTLVPLIPSTLGGRECVLSPNPFEASCLIANSSGSTVEDIQVCLSIPEELHTYGDFFHSPERCHTLNPATLNPDSFGTTAWLIKVDSTDYFEDTTIFLVLEITNSTFPDDTLRDTTFVEIPFISGSSPAITIVQPHGYISCAASDDIPMLIVIEGADRLELASLRIQIEGYWFDYLGGDFIFVGDTLVMGIPGIFFSHGHSVNYCLCGIKDVYGCSYSDTVWSSFTVDLEGPTTRSYSPPEGAIITDSLHTISLAIIDTLSGIDETSCILTVNGESYEWGDPELSWVDTMLIYTPSIPLPDRTTITVCLTEAYDDPDFCSPNPLSETCRWQFFVSYAGIQDTTSRVSKFKLFEPYPNPFNEALTIEFVLPGEQEIDLAIYDIYGQKVNALYQGPVQKGRQKFIWNANDIHGKDLASGIYLIVINTERNRYLKKVLLIK